MLIACEYLSRSAQTKWEIPIDFNSGSLFGIFILRREKRTSAVSPTDEKRKPSKAHSTFSSDPRQPGSLLKDRVIERGEET